MPGPYEVLNARVKQKINTEAQWIAEEDTFGVIFEGEQAFVYNDAGEPVNFKIGDGTKKFSELPYFIAYYSGVTAQKILTYLGQTANLTIPSVFKAKTLLQDIIFLNNSGGDISLKIGTTPGGSEISGTDDIVISAGPWPIGIKKEFEAVTTLYFTGLTGKAYDMFILYFQLDEAPAIPPTTGGGSSGFPKGYMGMFFPVYEGHANDAWDFDTGLGRPGFGYENCAICGTAMAPAGSDMASRLPIGIEVGDPIGTDTGSNSVSLVLNNIPKLKVQLPYNSNGVNGGTGIKLTGVANDTYDISVKAQDGSAMSSTVTPVDITPAAKKVLFFIAITDPTT